MTISHFIILIFLLISGDLFSFCGNEGSSRRGGGGGSARSAAAREFLDSMLRAANAKRAASPYRPISRSRKKYSRARHDQYLRELDEKERERIHAEYHRNEARKLETWEERDEYFKKVKQGKKLTDAEKNLRRKNEKIEDASNQLEEEKLTTWEEKAAYRDKKIRERFGIKKDKPVADPSPERYPASDEEDLEPWEEDEAIGSEAEMEEDYLPSY